MCATYHSMSFRSLDIIQARSNITMADCKENKKSLKPKAPEFTEGASSEPRSPVKPCRSGYSGYFSAGEKKKVSIRVRES